jgi:hypothetical protein
MSGHVDTRFSPFQNPARNRKPQISTSSVLILNVRVEQNLTMDRIGTEHRMNITLLMIKVQDNGTEGLPSPLRTVRHSATIHGSRLQLH